MRLVALIIVFIIFTAYTGSVMVAHGLIGFVTLAAREPWGMQLLVDLLLMLTLFALWVRRDARTLDLRAWPYVLLVLSMGSMGALLYLIRREVARRRSLSAGRSPG